MWDGPPRRWRARPVGDAPVDELVLRAEEIAKGWLLALLEQSSLDEAPAILAADLVRDGPRICAAAVYALATDADLARIKPGGALESLVAQTGEIAGARSAEAISRAVDALGAVIWSEIRDELSRPHPDQVAELAERLALVTELVRGAALRRSTAEALRRNASTPRVARGEEAAHPPPSSSGGGAARDPLWARALDDEIVRAEQSGSPLSLLLVELEDAERVLAAERGGAGVTFGRFARAVRGAARRQDILARETESRTWVIARDTARPGARALGERIVEAMREAHPWRGAPLTVTLGLAVFGEDGRDGEGLIDAAEQAMFVAAAGGGGVGEAPSPGPGRGETTGGSGPRLVD